MIDSSLSLTRLLAATTRRKEELVGDALRVLEERQRETEYLRREMQIGLDDFDRGDYEVYNDDSLKEFFEQIKAEGRKELEKESNAS